MGIRTAPHARVRRAVSPRPLPVAPDGGGALLLSVLAALRAAARRMIHQLDSAPAILHILYCRMLATFRWCARA